MDINDIEEDKDFINMNTDIVNWEFVLQKYDTNNNNKIDRNELMHLIEDCLQIENPKISGDALESTAISLRRSFLNSIGIASPRPGHSFPSFPISDLIVFFEKRFPENVLRQLSLSYTNQTSFYAQNQLRRSYIYG